MSSRERKRKGVEAGQVDGGVGSSGEPQKKPRGGPRKAAGVPKTALDKAVAAILALGKPSSAQAVTKYVEANYGYSNAPALKRAMKAAEGKALLKVKASYWVASKELPAASEGPCVSTELVRAGSDAAPPVGAGDTVAIDYELRLAAVPARVVERGKGFRFEVGAGDVIKGMDQGVLGMRLGERRKVSVPWKLGYGKRGAKPDIPGEADLVFDITLRQQD